MDNTKGIITKEAQIYIREVHRDTLVENGFSSLNGDDIAWYRIVNGEVLQSVHFLTRHTFRPIFLGMAYGCMPLYLEPMFPKGVYHYGLPHASEICTEVLLQGRVNRPYSQMSSVMCPMEGGRGLDILKEEILTPLDQIDSADACFSLHRSRYARSNTWHNMSLQFIDEVLYRQEQDLYEIGRKRVSHLLANLERNYISSKQISSAESHLELQKTVLLGGDREVFLNTLEKRRQKTLRILSKKAGIA